MMRYTSRGSSGGIDVRDVAKAVERLAEYEDTQLEPRDIEWIKKHITGVNFDPSESRKAKMTNMEWINTFFSDCCGIIIDAGDATITVETECSDPERSYTQSLEDWLDEETIRELP